MKPALRFDVTPSGPFNLLRESEYFGEWISLSGDTNTIVMTFPIEGWQGSCAVSLSQNPQGKIEGQRFGRSRLADRAKDQALSTLSLDIDGGEWPDTGKRDPVIGRLQKKYEYLRPVLFHSPYEAAAAFIIGHRISVKQRIAIMSRMSTDTCEKIAVEGEYVNAFPLPGALKLINAYPGLNEAKIGRLHAVADAAVNGLLERKKLRENAGRKCPSRFKGTAGHRAVLRRGYFASRRRALSMILQTIMLTRYAIQIAYNLKEPPDRETTLQIAEPWRPFRMWALVHSMSGCGGSSAYPECLPSADNSIFLTTLFFNYRFMSCLAFFSISLILVIFSGSMLRPFITSSLARLRNSRMIS